MYISVGRSFNRVSFQVHLGFVFNRFLGHYKQRFWKTPSRRKIFKNVSITVKACTGNLLFDIIF